MTILTLKESKTLDLLVLSLSKDVSLAPESQHNPLSPLQRRGAKAYCQRQFRASKASGRQQPPVHLNIIFMEPCLRKVICDLHPAQRISFDAE